MFGRSSLIIVWLCLLHGVCYASGLSDITGVNWDINNGTFEVGKPDISAIPRVIQNLPQDVLQIMTNPNGPAIAAAMRYSAGQARHGAQPMPANLKGMLSTFFPANILDKARWNTYDPNRIGLDNLFLSMQNDLWSTGAITLDEVIVFSDGSRAQNDWKLWAHELVHVSQFDSMGVEGFATVYGLGGVGWAGLEKQAYDYADVVEQSIGNNSQNRWHANYAVAPGSQLSSMNFIAAAQTFYPAGNCARWQTIMGGAQITNICVVPIVITGWTQINPATGSPYPGFATCYVDCWIGPGITKPFVSNVPGIWNQVFFRY
jgi:hypothetical protein